MENTKKKEKISKEVPQDAEREILSWLPKKSLMRFMCVSKNWSSTIRDDEKFKDLHYERSNTRPRALFVFCRKALDLTADTLFHSVYQEEEPLLSSGQKQMRITNGRIIHISAPIRGLICLQTATKVVICNPAIQKFQTLPGPNVLFFTSFFGYDEDLNVFKVLCTGSPPCTPIGTLVFHAYTVGSGEESWRPIVCNHRHAIATNALCKGGVIYYGAWDTHNRILMSFNVKSEEFTAIKLPRPTEIEISAKLVNYNGYIALVNDLVKDNGVIRMLVWYDTTKEWWPKRFEIRGWREVVGDMAFSFEGTIGLGELVFVQDGLLDGKSFVVLYYNTNTNCLRKFKIEGGVEGGSYHFARTFLNHVDTSLLQ